MATVSPTVADFSVQGSFTVTYQSPGSYVSSRSTGTKTQSYSLSGIPVGSTINSAVLYSTTTLSNYEVYSIQLDVAGTGRTNFYDISNGVRYKDVKSQVQALVTAGTSTLSVEYRFTPTTSNPSVIGSGTKYVNMTFASNSVVIDYTPPYTKCTAPTTVTVSPSSTGRSKTASLSWSGAGDGTNNAITGYDVYYSTTSSTSGFALLSSPTASPIDVTSSATNGGTIYYKVVAKGAAGASYYSDMSSAVATLTSTWTDATAPNSVTGPTNVVMSTTQRISWSGASGGTNNPIAKYQVFYSGDNYAAVLVETTNAYADVTSHATNGSSYTYKVKVVAEQNSVLSTASHTMTSLVGSITPPSSIAFDANNLAPGGQTAIRWSGQAGGTNNAIVSYDIQTSPDNATWTFVANTTNTAYSPATASATNNATVYYRVKLKGERIDAHSSSIGLVTKVTKPNPPSAISLNDSDLPVGWSTAKTLSWSGASAGTYNNDIYGYRVMVSVNGGALTQYGSDLVTANTYGSMTVTSLAANGTQQFYVHTIGATTITAEKLSAQSTAYDTLTTTVTNPTAPTAAIPTNVAPGSAQSLSWSGAVNGTNNAITTYTIYEKVDNGSWVNVGSDGASPFTVTAHASNGGQKSYYIIADGPHGDSPASNTVVMTTTVSKPNAPTTVSLSATANLAPNADVTLSWSGASNGTYNNPVNGYRVMRSVDGGAYAQVGTDQTAATTSMVVKTKNGNGTHAFKVIALGTNLGIHSDISASAATATTVVSVPAPPSVVEVVNGGGVAPGAVRLLRWSGATAGVYNNPIKGYQVYRSTAPTTGYATFGAAILNTNTYYEMNVQAPSSDGATYYYKIETLGNTLGINSGMSSTYGVLTTQKLPSTGTLNKSSLTATGSESITVTISPQLTTYTHKVTWYINGTYTSGVITKSAGTTTDTYTVPQSWILATTPTTTSVVAKCKVETFDGATSIGVNEYNFTVNVPGMSSFVLTGVPLTATGSAAATAAITATYSGYKHTVVWSTPGYSQTHNVAAGVTTQAYTIPKDWCNSAPNAEAFTITVTVTTIKVAGGGDMVLGSVSNSFVANIPSDIVPSITSFTKIGIDQKWSLYIRTKSKVKWTPVAAGSYSSTIVSYKIENINLNSGVLAYSAGTSWTSGILNYSGEQTFTLIVTDSRGRTASIVESITVTNYNPPAIASASFVRSDALGQINRTAGVYINLTASFTYSNIGTNAISAKAYYKEVGSGTWLPASGVAVSLTGTGPNMLGSVTYGSAAIDIAKVYDVKVAVSDEYNSPIELATIVPTVTRVFDFREGKAAFGGVAANLKELMLPSDWKIRIGTNEVLHIGNYSATVAAKVHTHVKANITDFPTSMPASDVSAWAKAATKPSYTHTEVGAAASSHSHSYLPLAGGTLTGHVYMNNNIGLAGKATDGTDVWLAYMSTANEAVLGYNTHNTRLMGATTIYAQRGNSTYVNMDSGNWSSYVTLSSLGAAASSHKHDTEYLQRFALGYVGDYGEVVIGLCEMTNTDPSLHSGVTGELTAMRTNGLYDPYVIRVAAQKIYNTTDARARWYRDANTNGTVIPVYFNYGGIRYFGFKFYPSAAQVDHTLAFKGEWWGTKPFMVEYKNQTTIINSEINNSLVNASNGEIIEDVKITSVNYTSYVTPANIGALPLSGGTLTGDLTGKNITSANTTYSATLGSIACTWSGGTSLYPTLYGSAADRWVMHINPHIVYVQNGTYGYTGTTNGARIRFGGSEYPASQWDIGVGVLGKPADTFTIGRRTDGGAETPFLTFDNSGKAYFTGNMQIGEYPNNPKTLLVRHVDGIVGENWENGSLYLNYHTTANIFCRGYNVNIDSGNYPSYVTPAGIGAATSGHGHTSGYYDSPLVQTDLNNHLSTGIFGWAGGSINAPYMYGQGINIVSSGSGHNNTNNWITQLCFGTNGEGYFRTKANSGGWDGWRTLLTTANYTSYVTPGSIGAAPASHSHNYFEKLDWADYTGTISTGTGFGTAAAYGPYMNFGTYGYVGQFSCTYANYIPRLFFRTAFNEGTYTPSAWVRLLHTGNVTKGTGAPSGGEDGDIYIKYS